MVDLPEHLQAIVSRAVATGVAQVVAELAKTQPPAAPADPRTMAELWDEYLPTLRNANSAANARVARKKGDVPFRHQGKTWRLSGLTYAQVTKSLARDWVKHLRTVKGERGQLLKATTVDQARKHWQAMLGYFVLRDEFPRNPFSRLRFEAQEGEGERQGYLTGEQVAKIAAHAPPMLAAMMRVAHRAGGLRNTELRTMRKVQIDWDTRKAWTVRKGGRITTFIVPPDALAILRTWCDASPSEYVFPAPRDPKGRPLPRQTFNAWFARARDAAGITLTGGEKPVPHHLRHGFIVEGLEKGAAEIHVAEQAGHKGTGQLARYGKLRGASEESYRELASMTVAEAKGMRRAEHRCPDCLRPYLDIRQAAACFDGHQRAAK